MKYILLYGFYTLSCCTLSANQIVHHMMTARHHANTKNMDAAIDEYKKALAIAPDNLDITAEYATLLINANHLSEALRLHHKLRAHMPNNLSVIYNTAYILKKMGRMREAQYLYRTVLQRQPDNAQAHVAIAQTLLSCGNFAEGWQELDWQFYPRIMSAHALRDYIDKHHDLTGKTVVIREDWSCGDTFQFLRFIKQLKTYNPRIIFAGRDRNKYLRTIIQMQPYIDEYVEPNTPLPAHDFITSSIGLPMVLHTTVATIPTKPYIHIPSNHIERWNNVLPHDTFNIGICWYGDPCHGADKFIPLSILAQLADMPHVQLYSLQLYNGLEQIQTLKHPERIHQFDATFDKTHGAFIDTAALMHHLDLIITVDTSLAHLAGAQGLPVWLILNELPDYRWNLAPTTSPWYPSMRIFKKGAHESWQHVLNKIQKELQCAVDTLHS